MFEYTSVPNLYPSLPMYDVCGYTNSQMLISNYQAHRYITLIYVIVHQSMYQARRYITLIYVIVHQSMYQAGRYITLIYVIVHQSMYQAIDLCYCTPLYVPGN